MQPVDEGAWGHDDGMNAPELDLIAICDVIWEDVRSNSSERKSMMLSPCAEMPLIGWSAAAVSAQHHKTCSIMSEKCMREDQGSLRCKTGESERHWLSNQPVPSLRSLALGYLAPYVADLVHEDAVHLPSSIRATLLALARRRHELSDAILMALVDETFASLDLRACAHVRPKTLVLVIARLPMLQSLDLSGCNFTSELVYSLPFSCPHLRVLRLSGTGTANVDLRAWQRLVPRVLPSTAETWEEDTSTRSRGLICLKWLCWPDVPTEIADLFLRRWPKVNLNHHALEDSQNTTKRKEIVPPEALPWVCLDDGPASAAAPSALRLIPAQTRVKQNCSKRHGERTVGTASAESGSMYGSGGCSPSSRSAVCAVVCGEIICTCAPADGFLRFYNHTNTVMCVDQCQCPLGADSDDEGELFGVDYVGKPLHKPHSSSAHAALQRWMDATNL